MGEGKIRKEHPVLLALVVLQGCTLKLTKHLVPGTECGRKQGWGGRGTKDRKGQTSVFTLQQQDLGEVLLNNYCPTQSLSPPLVLGAGATYKGGHP